jgi:hypothetical protein
MSAFTMSLTNAVTRAREPIEWDVPSLKELQNLASFCQIRELQL